MFADVPAVKINVSLHPAYATALDKERQRLGLPYGHIIERLLQRKLGVTVPPGTRQMRGRKRREPRGNGHALSGRTGRV